MLFGFYCLVTNGINCNLSTQLSSYFFLIVRLHIGGIDTRSGNVQYVPVISADIPSTWYIHRSRLSVPACTKDLYINESTYLVAQNIHGPSFTPSCRFIIFFEKNNHTISENATFIMWLKKSLKCTWKCLGGHFFAPRQWFSHPCSRAYYKSRWTHVKCI